MGLPVKARHLPVRVAIGAFVLNSGVTKWSGDAEAAKGLHAMASGTYPFLKKLQPEQFLRLLSAAEIGLGAALLLPVVPTALAATALAGFSGGLLGLYLRTPGLREEGSLRPTHNGTPIAKDVWMFGAALSMLVDTATDK